MHLVGLWVGESHNSGDESRNSALKRAALSAGDPHIWSRGAQSSLLGCSAGVGPASGETEARGHKKSALHLSRNNEQMDGLSRQYAMTRVCRLCFPPQSETRRGNPPGSIPWRWEMGTRCCRREGPSWSSHRKGALCAPNPTRSSDRDIVGQLGRGHCTQHARAEPGYCNRRDKPWPEPAIWGYWPGTGLWCGV